MKLMFSRLIAGSFLGLILLARGASAEIHTPPLVQVAKDEMLITFDQEIEFRYDPDTRMYLSDLPELDELNRRFEVYSMEPVIKGHPIYRFKYPSWKFNDVEAAQAYRGLNMASFGQQKVKKALENLKLADSHWNAERAIATICKVNLDKGDLAEKILQIFEDKQNWPKDPYSLKFSQMISGFSFGVIEALEKNPSQCPRLEPARVAALFGSMVEYQIQILSQADPERLSRTYDDTIERITVASNRGLGIAEHALEAAKLSGREEDLMPSVLATIQKFARHELEAQVNLAQQDFEKGMDWLRARRHLRVMERNAQKAGLDPAPYTTALRQKYRSVIDDVLGTISPKFD